MNPGTSTALPTPWTLAVGLVLTGASSLALLLGLSAVRLTHGAGAGDGFCGVGDGCAQALADPSATASGVPVMIWALPVYVVGLVLLRVAARPDPRGSAARGGLIGLAILLVVANLAQMLVVDGAAACIGCLALSGLHLLLLALLVAPGGQRLPAWPSVDEWLPGMLLGLTVLMGAGFGARLVGFHLDADADAALAEPALELPADAVVATELRDLPAVAVPAPESPSPIDDQDPSVGPLTADVTAVAFLDLQDPASQTLAWALIDLEERYDDRVRFVTKHLPMDASCNEKRRRTTHPQACAVATALQCAHLQGAFRAYRHSLLRNPHKVAEADLLSFATGLGLDGGAFTRCRQNEGLEAVEADVKQAAKGKLGDPPWLFIEGRVLEGSVHPNLIEATLALALGEREADSAGLVAPRMPLVIAPPLPAEELAMVALDGFAIDAVEASIDTAGRARSRVGQLPAIASQAQAQAACAASGRRLCTRTEWVTACQGTAPVDDDGDGEPFGDLREGRLQPYGDNPRNGWCRSAGMPSATGAPACKTPEGIYNLAGNRAEWVTEGQLLGGMADDGPVGCHIVTTPPGPGWRSTATGFRCCADRIVPAPDDSSAASVPAPQLPAPTLPTRLAELAAGEPVIIVPLTIDCASCQQALLAARTQPRVLALALDPDPAMGADWLEASGLQAQLVSDPDASLAGALGVPGLPWVGRYDGQGRLIASWKRVPSSDELSSPVPAAQTVDPGPPAP